MARKSTSRASRFQTAVDAIEEAKGAALSVLEDLIDERAERLENAKPEQGKEDLEDMTTDETERLSAIVSAFKETLESACGDIEGLKEEMESWRDNMSSANMEHLPKYDEVSECCDALESTLDDLQNVDISEEDAESAKEDIESVDPTSNEPMFPGMY